MVRIGAHLHDADPLAAAQAAGAEAAQFFLGDPQGWKAPTFPGDREPDEVRAAFAAAGIDAYVHAPYVINVASPNNRIRIPSRKLLEQQLAAAASIGAKGLIVHGGHVTAGIDPEEGYDSWRKAVERIERPLPHADREHRGRRRRHGPQLRRDRPAVGGHRRRRGERRRGRVLPGHLPRLLGRARNSTGSSTGSRRSPAGSTSCTATTRGTSSTPAGTGTRASSRGRSTRRRSWT